MLGHAAISAVYVALATATACSSGPAYPGGTAPAPPPTHAPPPSDEMTQFGGRPARSGPTSPSTTNSESEGGTPQARLEANLGRAVRANMDSLHRCYEEGRKRNPSLKGVFTMSVLVAPTGKIVKVDSDPSATTLDDPLTVGCMTGVMAGVDSIANPMGTEFRATYGVNFSAPPGSQ